MWFQWEFDKIQTKFSLKLESGIFHKETYSGKRTPYLYELHYDFVESYIIVKLSRN